MHDRRAIQVSRTPPWAHVVNRTTSVTGGPEADLLVDTDPLALLLGMLLDQHMR